MGNIERPEYIWFKGKICKWEEAHVHVWSELATRGANVFEGIRCYKQQNGKYALLSLEEHLKRLERSARLMYIENPYSLQELKSGIMELIKKIGTCGCGNLYIRPTIYVENGRYGNLYGDAVNNAYIVCVPVERDVSIKNGIKCCISTYRRCDDMTFSPLIKAGAAYQAFRIPAIEAKMSGYDDVIFLNNLNYVSETTAAAIFLVKDKTIITPPLNAGILDSITRKNIIYLAKKQKLCVIEKNITRVELYTADEVFTAGTLSEITPILQIDKNIIGMGKVGEITKLISDMYTDICEGNLEDELGWLEYVK